MVGLQPLNFYNIFRQKSYLNTKKGITWNYEMILCSPLILIIESELQYIPRIVNLVNEVDSYTPPFLYGGKDTERKVIPKRYTLGWVL